MAEQQGVPYIPWSRSHGLGGALFKGQKMVRYNCRECGKEESGKTDCLKHAQKYGHHEFIDKETGQWYYPEYDPELLEEEV